MKYKLVIFDFDGTLADSFPWFLGIVNKVADKYDFKRVDLNKVDTFRGYDIRKISKHLEIPLWKFPIIGSHIRKMMAREIHKITLFNGIDQLLKKLSDKGIKLAVVSSNSYENITHILGPVNRALIKYYECGVSLFGKPSKLKNVIKKSGVSHHESILIGDEIRDIEAANNVNIAFGAVSWGYSTVEAFEPFSPKEIFRSIDDIVEKII